MKARFLMPIAVAIALLLGLPAGAHAGKIEAVASFSILGDMVREVGGDRVEVTTLVGPDGDAHVVVASKGVTPRHMMKGKMEEITDPHAWQSLANGKIYVANIRDGLIAADPKGKPTYEANAAKYLDAIAKEEASVKETLDKLPEDRRRIITSHDAFGYFGAAYGIEVIAPEGVSTESEASAKDVAKIIRQIKAENIPAVFIENITNHRLLDQIARETGAKIGGTLYTDALSQPDGPAPTYLGMFRHNIEALSQALSS